MSSYETTCYDRKTVEEHLVVALDNHYGKHSYGYRIDGVDPFLTQEQFNKLYTMEKPE